jgi:SAM-dependent methyltransferase
MSQDSLYNYPLYYDIAFDRDLEPDITFIEGCMARWNDQKVSRILELGCGPGYHTLGLARRGYDAIGLDLNPLMISYTRAKAERQNIQISLILGDMLDFQLTEPVDMALSMMATSTLIFSLDDMVQHLQVVARNLRDGGLYILEMSHPSDIFIGAGPAATVSRWTTTRDDLSIAMQWGGEKDTVDPITETHVFQVTMTITENEATTNYHFEETQAIWTPKEVEAAVRLSGVFDVMDWYGTFDINQAFNNSRWSWRMIPVLRKKMGM